MHECDGDGVVAGGLGGGEVALQRRDARFCDDFTLSADTLIDFIYGAVKQFRQDDMPIEDAWTVLPGDAQGIAEAAGDEQRNRFTFAFQ